MRQRLLRIENTMFKMQRVCVSCFQSHINRLMLFSTTTTAATTSTASFAVYLVDSLGVSHQQALSASTKLSKYRKVNHFNFLANANSVLTFFRNYGFDNTHLIKMVFSDPRVLCSNVDNTIEPKFKFLKDHGFSGSDLIRLISANPSLLKVSLEASLSPALQILRQLLVCDSLVTSVIKKLCRVNCSRVCNNLMPNVDMLTGYGIPIEFIRKHLVRQPRVFLQNPETFKERLIRVEKKIGISPNAPMFLYGVTLVSTYSEESIESKCRMLKSFGWTQSDVDTFMTKNAHCFSLSAASLKKKLDFLMNELRLEPAYLTSNVYLLTYSLEKKIVPRHRVLLILKDKGLLKKYPSFGYVVRIYESRFLERFVLPFKEVHQVYANHTGHTLEMRPTKSTKPFLKE